MGCGLAGERNLPLVKTHNHMITDNTLAPRLCGVQVYAAYDSRDSGIPPGLQDLISKPLRNRLFQLLAAALPVNGIYRLLQITVLVLIS
jgi:hypothetical protein